MITCTSPEYSQFLRHVWTKKVPLMVYGAPGIGKSEIPREVFRQTAADNNRKFAEWAELTREEKLDAIAKPEEYFIFTDLRIAGMDATDLRGLPKLEESFIVSTPYSWVSYYTSPKAMGVIFFDEINLAPPMIAAQAYEIILDRTIADRKLSPDVLVIGAGNRAVDAAYTYPMPGPLKDRFCEIELACDKASWVKWAARHRVNPNLIAFINWKESYLHTLSKVAKAGEEKGATPRGIVRASTLIGDMDITDAFVFSLVSASCGEEFATEFNGFISVFKEISWEDLFANPAMAAKFKNDRAWAICGGLEEQFAKHPERIDDILAVMLNLQEEFAVVAAMILDTNHHDPFLKAVRKSPNFAKFVKKLGKIFM